MSKLTKLTGIAVPLGALYSKENGIIGEYEDLIPFSQFCKKAGIGLIQLLPVNDTGTQSSPYSGLSAFALHPIYIRLSSVPGFEEICLQDAKFAKDYAAFVKANKYSSRYNYDEILNSKDYFLRNIYAHTSISKTGKADKELSDWINKNAWIKSYCVYKKLKWDYMQASWKSWKKADQNKSEKEINELWDNEALKTEHLYYAWCQLIAEQQFSKAVTFVHNEGILLKGDMPILMNEDSCDAWAYPEFFNQELRAGSPKDGENPAGQNWGFPTYNWKNLKANNYSWWINRLKNSDKYYDAYRLDHILGFFRIWAIPSGDCNALNGHTEPYAFIKKDELYELGFDDDRIRWLSRPHVPTQIVEDVTWNREVAHNILEVFCNRIGSEELWLFNEKLSGSQQIWDTDLSSFVDEGAAVRIKEKLVEYWSNKTLIEVAKAKFVPMWNYAESTAWSTLSDKEKEELLELFEKIDGKNEKLWTKQAEEIFTAITSQVKMIPCGEDLGVGIKCVPSTMKKFDILSLKVVRWNRYWEKPEQPYVAFEDYPEVSVCTTSVHDSSTLRQWWEDEEGVCFFTDKDKDEKEEFSPELAEEILTECAGCKSKWFVPPLQDFLYMNKKYWLEDAEQERINVPGSVNKFNWTYRIPACIEDLEKDKSLISKINKICKR